MTDRSHGFHQDSPQRGHFVRVGSVRSVCRLVVIAFPFASRSLDTRIIARLPPDRDKVANVPRAYFPWMHRFNEACVSAEHLSRSPQTPSAQDRYLPSCIRSLLRDCHGAAPVCPLRRCEAPLPCWPVSPFLPPLPASPSSRTKRDSSAAACLQRTYSSVAAALLGRSQQVWRAVTITPRAREAQVWRRCGRQPPAGSGRNAGGRIRQFLGPATVLNA